MKLFDKIDSFQRYSSDISNKYFLFTDTLKARKFCFALTVAVSFIGIFILNRIHPLFADDWMYSMLPEPHDKRIENLSEILYTQYKHYFTWGGRSVVHVIAQSLLLLDSLPADFLNSVAYVLLTLVIYKVANAGKETNPALLVSINLLICLFQPAFGSTMLWLTGSANYLWGTLIIISFILPYRLYLLGTEKQQNRLILLKTIAFFLFGIVAGWTNENMAVGLVVMIILFLFYFKYSGKKIPMWAVAGLIGVAIGAAFMIAAPGNYVRMGMMTHATGISKIELYIKQFFTAISSYYYYCFSLTFILALLACLYSAFASVRSEKKEIKHLVLIFLIGIIVATLAMTASPFFPGRASYGINTLLVIVCAMLFAHLDFNKLFIKRFVFVTLLFGLLFFIADYYRGYKELSATHKVLEKRNAAVLEGKKNGVANFIFNDRIPVPQTRYLHYFDLSDDTTNWHNASYSKYHDIQSIKVE